MAKKRTKLDRSQRQSDQLEKRADTRPEQMPKKRKPREDPRQAAAQEETGNHTMERFITCQNATCRKSFKAASPGRPSDYAELPEVDAEAICTNCGTLNRITWPKGVKFITAPLIVASPGARKTSNAPRAHDQEEHI